MQSFIPLSRVMRSLSSEGGSPTVGMTQSVPGTSLAGMTAGVSDQLCSYTESLTGSLEFWKLPEASTQMGATLPLRGGSIQ